MDGDNAGPRQAAELASACARLEAACTPGAVKKVPSKLAFEMLLLTQLLCCLSPEVSAVCHSAPALLYTCSVASPLLCSCCRVVRPLFLFQVGGLQKRNLFLLGGRAYNFGGCFTYKVIVIFQGTFALAKNRKRVLSFCSSDGSVCCLCRRVRGHAGLDGHVAADTVIPFRMESY